MGTGLEAELGILDFKAYVYPVNAEDRLHEAMEHGYCKGQEKGRNVFLLQVVRKEILFALSKILLNYRLSSGRVEGQRLLRSELSTWLQKHSLQSS